MFLARRHEKIAGLLALALAGVASAQDSKPLPAAVVTAPVLPECAAEKFPDEKFVTGLLPGTFNVPVVGERPFDPDSGDRTRVRRFVVEGAARRPDERITPEKMQAVADAAFAKVAGAQGEALMTVGQMQRVADAVTTYYRNNGFLVAQAFIPAQVIEADAAVRLRVLEGRVSEVVVDGATRYSGEVLLKSAASLVGAPPLQDEVETALLYAQDYPGVRLFGTFRPGAATGETRLVLQVREEDRFSYALGGDNYGNELTGEFRLQGDASWLSPSGRGDRLDLTLLQTAAPVNTTLGSVNYSYPVGPPGLVLTAGASRVKFVAEQDPTNVDGLVDGYNAGATWRFKRSRFFNADAGLSLVNEASKVTLGSSATITDNDLDVLVLQGGLDRVDTRFKGVDQVTLILRRGLRGDFGASSALSEENFNVFQLRYNRLQVLTETQTLVGTLRLQEASDLLSVLEQFALAGPDAVRAYPVGNFLRDSGGLLSLEYRVQAPGFSQKAGPFGRSWGDLFQVRAFVDYAYGENAKDNISLPPTKEDISGGGLGLHFAVSGKFQALLQGARRISGPEASDGSDSRVYAQFTVFF